MSDFTERKEAIRFGNHFFSQLPSPWPPTTAIKPHNCTLARLIIKYPASQLLGKNVKKEKICPLRAKKERETDKKASAAEAAGSPAGKENRQQPPDNAGASPAHSGGAACCPAVRAPSAISEPSKFEM